MADPSTTTSTEAPPMPITVLRDNGLSALLAGDLELLAQGLQFTEGPLELGDGSLLFQDIKAERPTSSPAGTQDAKVLREQTGAANGQTFGPDGWIYFCEQNGRRVSRMKPDGSSVETVVEEFDGHAAEQPERHRRPLRTATSTSPTRPTASAAPTAPCTSRASTASTPRRTTSSCSSTTSRSPTASPSRPTSGSSTSATRPSITSAPSRSSRRASSTPPRAGSSPRQDPADPGGPDGMKVDADGRVYVAVAQGVWVYEPDGRLLGIIPTPPAPPTSPGAATTARPWRSRPSTRSTRSGSRSRG